MNATDYSNWLGSVQREPGEELSSCEAQREHCAMFIASQKYEGWELLRARFDDVGRRSWVPFDHTGAG